MTVLVFVDTSVFLYAVDDREPDKQALARTWIAWCWVQHAGRVSTQVLNEYYANAITRFQAAVSVPTARRQVQDLRQWQPPHLDTYTVDGAWALQDRFGLSYWDALIVSSAQQQGCNVVLSEDMQHGQRFDRIQLINPFLVRPEQLDAQLSP